MSTEQRDIVERLRSRAWENRQHRVIRAEAADTIERMRKALDDLYNHNAATRAAVIEYYGVNHLFDTRAPAPRESME